MSVVTATRSPGRTALVTGASGGLGRALAERLRADGMKVITRDLTGACDLKADLRTDPLDQELLGSVDVCVSNAAITTTIAPAHRMTREQWDGDIAVNLSGAFRAIQACLPGMRERGWGRVIAISSGAAKLGLSGQAAYAASKAGLHGLIRTLAIECRAHGITANCVLPGMVATPPVLKMPQPVLERVLAAMPMGRMATPEEVAALVAFLAGEEAGYITAQEIAIDGGLGLNPISLGTMK